MSPLLTLPDSVIDAEVAARAEALKNGVRAPFLGILPEEEMDVDPDVAATYTPVQKVLAEHGIKHPITTTKAAKLAEISIAELCAVLIAETSGGLMEFGDDPGNPINNRNHRWVTKALYDEMVGYVNKGYPSQGVGDTQLTSRSLQEECDRYGGSWVHLPNQHIGGVVVRQLIAKYGLEGGFQHFNGSGPAAEAYGKAQVARTAQFNAWIKAAK